jgi:DNA-binding Xre family transcriptional regulator
MTNSLIKKDNGVNIMNGVNNEWCQSLNCELKHILYYISKLISLQNIDLWLYAA